MPMGYPLCLPLGGGPDDVDVEQQALLDALSPGLDPTAPEQIAQTYGEALAVVNVWQANRRLSGQLDPNRMIETLPTWEQACGIRPTPGELDDDRRAAVAARFMGFAGNAISQIRDVCATICGTVFVGLFFPSMGLDTSSFTTYYMPGLMPGPPGFEFTSPRAHICVQLVRTGLPDAALIDLIRRLRLELEIVCPCWLTFTIGTLDNQGSNGCVPGQAIPGLSIL